MCTDNFGNATRQEIPDDDTAIVAAHRQQGAPAVKRTGEGHANTIQGAISLLSTHTPHTPWHTNRLWWRQQLWMWGWLQELITGFCHGHMNITSFGHLPLDSSAQMTLGGRTKQRKSIMMQMWSDLRQSNKGLDYFCAPSRWCIFFGKQTNTLFGNLSEMMLKCILENSKKKKKNK